MSKVLRLLSAQETYYLLKAQETYYLLKAQETYYLLMLLEKILTRTYFLDSTGNT